MAFFRKIRDTTLSLLAAQAECNGDIVAESWCSYGLTIPDGVDDEII